MDRGHCSERALDWPACHNVRDLGGLPAGRNRRTRRGVVVRADDLSRLDAAGWRALVACGMRTVIDLRSPWEWGQGPYAVPPEAAVASVTRLSRPFVPADRQLDAALADPANSGREYAILLDRCATNVAAILRAIRTAPPGGVVVHCRSGKDHTGIIAALLLGLAGVAEDVITIDYLESEPRLAPLWEEQVTAGNASPDDRPQVWPAVFQTLLDHLACAYGGAAGYMAAAGLTPHEIHTLRERLLAPQGGPHE